MTFLNPTLAVAGLVCVMVPIIIHILMRRRRRPVPWAAMRFVLEAYRRQRRRMNLEQLLLLAARCAMILLLAMAVGRPVLGAAGLIGGRGARTLYLLVDNSLSAGVVVAPGQESEFEAAKKLAIASIDSLDASKGDRVAIIAAASPIESMITPATPELASARQVLRELRLSHAHADWGAAIRAVLEQVERERQRGGEQMVVLLSHWREGAIDLETAAPTPSTEARIRWIATAPSTDRADNVAVVSVEPVRSLMMAPTAQGLGGEVGGLPVRVRLARSGAGMSSPASSLLRLELFSAGGESLAAADQAKQIISWAPGQQEAEAFVTVASPAGEHRELGDRSPIFVVASIDEDALSPDNKAAAVVQMRDRLDVAMVAPPGSGALGGDRTGDLATYSAPDWLAMALSPRGDFTLRQRQGGELRVQVVDPQQGIAPTVASGGSGRGAGALAGMDAVIVPRPSLLDAAGWRALRESLDSGACIIIAPEAKTQTQVWTEQVKLALGVDWNIGRDPTTFATPARLNAVPAAVQAKRSGGLLSMIESELPELVRSVTVSRVLPIQPAGDGFDTLLSLADGTPWIVASTPDTASVERRGTRRGTVVLFASAVDAEWTDLPARPLMVPLVQELARQGISRGVGVATIKAGQTPATLEAGAVDLASVPRVHGDEAEASRVVGVDAKGHPQSPLRTRSAWVVRSDSGLVIGATVVNADADASGVGVRTREQIASWLRPCTSELSWMAWEGEPASANAADASPSALGGAGAATPPVVSFPLLVAAAFVGLLELVAARWFSHAHQSSFTRQGHGGSRA